MEEVNRLERARGFHRGFLVMETARIKREIFRLGKPEVNHQVQRIEDIIYLGAPATAAAAAAEEEVVAPILEPFEESILLLL